MSPSATPGQKQMLSEGKSPQFSYNLRSKIAKHKGRQASSQGQTICPPVHLPYEQNYRARVHTTPTSSHDRPRPAPSSLITPKMVPTEPRTGHPPPQSLWKLLNLSQPEAFCLLTLPCKPFARKPQQQGSFSRLQFALLMLPPGVSP